MALTSRSTRRASSGRRWLVVGVIITLLVILIDASIKSRSPGPTRTLAEQSWTDRSYALITDSNVQGRDLSSFLISTSGETASSATSQLQAMASGAAATYKAYSKLKAPSDLAAPAGLLEACLLVRSQASAVLASAVEADLKAPATVASAGTAASAVAAAVEKLQVADQAYRLFVAAVPASLRAPPPTSQWIPSVGNYGQASLQVFLTGLRNRVSLVPVSQLTIESVSTVPSAVGSSGTTEILSPSHDLTVSVVVGNTGNQTESGLTVNASITPAAGADTAREFVENLAPGGSQTVTIGYLNPPLGQRVTLTVNVTPAAGSTLAPVNSTLQFEMPAPSSSTTTTTTSSTTTPAASTTVPGG